MEKLKIPILLNYSQCKLINKEYYPVIEYTTTVLEKDPSKFSFFLKRERGANILLNYNPFYIIALYEIEKK